METNKQDKNIKETNEAVEKAYLTIIKEVKQALALFPTEELRTYVEREGNGGSHSFYCHMIYISKAEYFGKHIIAFAKNFRVKPHIGAYMDTLIPRIIYKQTSVAITKTDIETRIEEYPYKFSKMEDALKFSGSLANYKKEIVSPLQEA